MQTFEEDTGNINNNLQLIEIINILGSDYSNIYSVDRKSRKIQIYRYDNDKVGVREALKEPDAYETAINNYITNNVFSEDRNKLIEATRFENICFYLKKKPLFTVHYRVKRNSEILSYYMKCARVGDAEDFQTILFGFASEEDEVSRNKLNQAIEFGNKLMKRKVLIIEDNEINQEVLSTILEDKYDIMRASDGIEGLKILEEHYSEISVILLDIMMPVCDGRQFLKIIKDDPILSSIPVIVTTGSDRNETEQECLELGAADFIVKPYNANITRKRIDNLIRLRESSITLESIEYDELTGLYTKQAFNHYFETLIRDVKYKKIHVIVSRVSGFNQINNIYGRNAGDNLLCYLAEEYKKNMRDGLIARVSGGTFVCVLCGDEDIDREYFLDNVKRITQNAPIPRLRVKYGIYENVDKSLSSSIIYDRACMAVKAIDENYEHNIAYFTDDMNQKVIRREKIENCFEDALDNNEFVVYYQPKFATTDEKMVGAEALVRWRKNDAFRFFPGEFIPVYEKNGMITKLDECVFRQVCAFQADRIKSGKDLFPISVNLSRISICADGTDEKYTRIASEYGVPLKYVPLELTESATINGELSARVAKRLAEIGFALHVDDFGTGYSSLASLNEIAFSTLKIDKSLIDCVNDEKGRKLVALTAKFAKCLNNMEIVAEGVETREQLEIIREMDVDIIQGFYYSGPIPPEKFKTYYEERNKA